MRRANYDKFPRISVPNSAGACVAGWGAGVERLRQAVAERGARKTTIVVECYPGVDEREVLCQLQAGLRPALALRAEEALLAPREIETLVAPFLGGDDPVFGFLSGLTLPQFFAPARVAALAAKAAAAPEGVTVIVGVGARLVARGDILIYADLPRWEAQKRFRRKEAANLGTSNHGLAANLQYKRAYFVDWRVADRWKRPLLHEWDFVLDTIAPGEPKLAEGEAVRRALDHAVTRPFRVAPFFDPAPWGGQWMREVCDLGAGEANYGWCFDGVPEENSLLLDFDGVILELPALDLVFYRPRALLGEAVHARFGDEFPIRFDFLDTMGGGNLSFQVHPLTEYIQQHFGMHYTQDESYYVLDAGPEAQVYLGLRDGVNRTAMIRDLALAQAGQIPFPVEKYAGAFAARPHDHFLIPAGTPHCAGANAMVLEISATPYIFTFKMWDWGRLGLDGAPRPIHLQHGIANIQWDRTAAWGAAASCQSNRARGVGGRLDGGADGFG